MASRKPSRPRRPITRTRKPARAAKRKPGARRGTTTAAARAAAAAGRGPGGRERRRHVPETLRVGAFEPTFTVDDVSRSERFYTEVLGFVVDERWVEEGQVKGVLLKAGSSRLGLSQDDWAQGRDRKKGVGTSLYLQTVQDLDALAARCRAHGVEVYGPKTEPWGARVLHVVDPDGFKLVFTPPETTGSG